MRVRYGEVMRHVPAAEFRDHLDDYLDAAASGEDVVVTREDRLPVRLTAAASGEADRLERQREAFRKAYEFGQSLKARIGPTSAAEIRALMGRDD